MRAVRPAETLVLGAPGQRPAPASGAWASHATAQPGSPAGHSTAVLHGIQPAPTHVPARTTPEAFLRAVLMTKLRAVLFALVFVAPVIASLVLVDTALTHAFLDAGGSPAHLISDPTELWVDLPRVGESRIRLIYTVSHAFTGAALAASVSAWVFRVVSSAGAAARASALRWGAAAALFVAVENAASVVASDNFYGHWWVFPPAIALVCRGSTVGARALQFPSMWCYVVWGVLAMSLSVVLYGMVMADLFYDGGLGTRLLVRLAVHPLLVELAVAPLRAFAVAAPSRETAEAVPLFAVIPLLVCNTNGRFLAMFMGSATGTAVVLAGLTVQELVIRKTVRQRDRFYCKLFGAKRHLQALDSLRAKRTRATMHMLDELSEDVSIVAAAAIIWAYQLSSAPDETPTPAGILLNMALQLAVELLADLSPIVRYWLRRRAGTEASVGMALRVHVREQRLPWLLVGAMYASWTTYLLFSFFAPMFNVLPYLAAPGDWYFVWFPPQAVEEFYPGG